jgi:uncharacterized protein (DUF4415 family)
MEGVGTETTAAEVKGTKMSEERRQNEIARREEAQAHAGEVVAGSGKRGVPRRMSQMVSVRLDADLISELRIVCERRGVSLSDILRDGARLMVQREHEDMESESWFAITSIKGGATERFPHASSRRMFAHN